MNTLIEILSSRTRAEIFKLLFGPSEEELHIREIQRRTGLNDSTIRQELVKLLRLDLVIDRKDSNRLYYRANKSNPLYPDIRNLVIKTIGLVDVIRDALQDKRIQIAFVFGSLSNGKETAVSDVDMIIIGKLGMRAVSALLSGAADKIGREINAHVMTGDELRKRYGVKEHFIISVMKSPKLFVVGTEDDLKAMAK
jgi:DNA-binding transcriptional ArsR family regulator